MITRTNKLPPDRQRELFLRWKEHGDQAAAKELTQSLMALVVHIARRYAGRGSDREDLESAGLEGVAKALTKYDPDKGTRFATYARFWIEERIFRHVYRNWSELSWGMGNFLHLFWSLYHEQAPVIADGPVCYKVNGHVITLTPEDRAAMITQIRERHLPFDTTAIEGSEVLVVDILIARQSGTESGAEDMIDDARLSSSVTRLIGELSHRERLVLEKRAMEDYDQKWSLREVGEAMGVSGERVRQIEQTVLKRLRKSGRWRKEARKIGLTG